MIRHALEHLPGLGPARIRELRRIGIDNWLALRDAAGLPALGAKRHAHLLDCITQCETALQRDDIGFLTRTLSRKDLWRVLNEYFERASFFDIETNGMGPDSRITLIACYHKDRMYTFLQDENLNDFLDLLDEVDLLVSYNGACFDVPFVERAFNIPEIPCPHIDLRWLCRQQELRGGLKSIEQQLGIDRPPDLVGVDGEEAVWLWDFWHRDRDTRAREKLIRYCCADVLSLKLVAGRILRMRNCPAACPNASTLWDLIPRELSADPQPARTPAAPLPNREQQIKRLMKYRLKQSRTAVSGGGGE